MQRHRMRCVFDMCQSISKLYIHLEIKDRVDLSSDEQVFYINKYSNLIFTNDN